MKIFYNPVFGKIRLIVLVVLFVAGGYSFIFNILDRVFPLNTKVEYSTTVLSDKGHLLYAFLTSDEQWRMYTELNEITPELKKAIVFKEDKYFYYHPGINPVAICRAFIKNLISGKRTSGASTITMQVARMLNPKARTYMNKLKEAFRALQLEWHLSKDQILQLYLNLVPYGGNIQGVKSASVLYFGKMPNHLSIGEIATLSIIPNRPVSLRLGENNDYIKKERDIWLRRYKKNKLFKAAYIDDALQEPLSAYRRQINHFAPHLSIRLKSQFPDTKNIHSTIDLEMQRKAEKIVGDYSKRLYFQNIKNAMALVIDNASHEVKAYVGSADFNNNEDGGQVDGIRAVRSPGSTLKPLLYATAMDEGLVTPMTVISDVPTSFGGYEPENYDEKFNGNITIEEALARSLNVPAVKVLDKLGTDKMIDKLILADFHQIKHDRKNLGLSLILGGCGVTLEELGGLYSAFANKGVYYPLRYIVSGDSSKGRVLISKSAAFMVTEILTKLRRPDLPVQWSNDLHTPKIAWKTGTSYGRKDAWSIGFNKKYTIAVWVGNFSAEGVPDLSGSEKATPLLFRLFNAFDYNAKEGWFKMPKELRLRYVCAVTGKIPNTFCKDQVIDYYIPGVSSEEVCHHLKTVYISPDSSISYCTSCRPKTGYITALYPNLSPEIISYYEANQIPYKKIPPHNPKCERLFGGSAPQITSPINENDYFVNISDSMEIMLSCHAANDVQKVYWYINKKFYREANAGDHIFFRPNEGKVNISCSDDKGRNTDISINVKYTAF